MAKRYEPLFAFLRRKEGLRLRAYLDDADVWTIGYGHAILDEKGRQLRGAANEATAIRCSQSPITKTQAERLLQGDVRIALRAVARHVRVPLRPSQRMALASWTFNLGELRLRQSTLLRKLNDGDYGAVPLEMKRWVRGGGRILGGLVTRRDQEVAMWTQGTFA